MFSGSNVTLGVSSTGLLVINPSDKSVLLELAFAEVEAVLLDPAENFVTVNLRQKAAATGQRVHVFETAAKAEVSIVVDVVVVVVVVMVVVVVLILGYECYCGITKTTVSSCYSCYCCC